MSLKKMLFVYNPHAGKAQIKNNLLDIIDIFTKAGYEVTAYPTQRSEDAMEVTRERSGNFDLLVCSGGDGTLGEVVSGMMQRNDRIPLGYVPAGSTNDFAVSLGVPKQMRKAAHAIVDGQIFSCDVGAFNDSTFVYVAAFGMFSEVSYETSQKSKNLLGHMAYMLEGAKKLASTPSYRLHYSYEGEFYEDEFMFGMITNSRSVGGFPLLTGKSVKFDDGIFEGVLIKAPKNVIETNQILAAVLSRKINPHFMHHIKTGHIEINATDAIPWNLDGEFGGEHHKAVIRNVPQALRILLPSSP